MNKYIEALFGFHPAALASGLKSGPRALFHSCRAAYRTTTAKEDFEQKKFHDEFYAIPEISLGDVLRDRKAEIKLQVMKYEDGMMPTRDAIGLLSILVAERPDQVLEIGTFMGHTTRAMAENLEHAIIHTMDLPQDFQARPEAAEPLPKDDFHLISRRIVGREFKGLACEKRIVQHFGDTATLDFKTAGQPTFFFIDGSHTYEYCKSDSEKCLAIAAVGSTFIWHDCNLTHPGVIRFISEWRSAGRNLARLQGTDLAYWRKN